MRSPSASSACFSGFGLKDVPGSLSAAADTRKNSSSSRQYSSLASIRAASGADGRAHGSVPNKRSSSPTTTMCVSWHQPLESASPGGFSAEATRAIAARPARVEGCAALIWSRSSVMRAVSGATCATLSSQVMCSSTSSRTRNRSW